MGLASETTNLGPRGAWVRGPLVAAFLLAMEVVLLKLLFKLLALVLVEPK